MEKYPHRGPAGTAMFELAINVAENAGELVCQLDHAELFDAATAQRWLGHFRTLLEAIAAQPETRISELPLLNETERNELLVKWNDTSRDFQNAALLHRLFEAQVERTPGEVAVVFENQTLTYGALNKRANQLANHLRKLGVGRDALVGICMDRSIELVVSIFAVLKSGGAYVPLDPSYPADRLAHMIADARMPVILAQKSATDSLAKHSARVVCVESENFTGESDANLPSDGSFDDLAYVIFTSGSTGKPKGVMISHHAICNHMLWMQSEFPLDARDRVLQKTPISFDASVWEFYAPLFAGARLVMARPGGHRDSRYLTEVIAQNGITILQLVPSMLRMMIEEKNLTRCAGLRRVFVGGEPLLPELCESFFARLNECELVNLYGPTECAIDASFHRCERSEKITPIGQPVANTQLYILDGNQQLVPVGVRGELHIGGEQLARGYLHNAELTAAKFVEFDGRRVYKTGDLARWLPNGEVEFLGRADDQVKLRGHRIELGEIESALEQQPGVAESAVIVREDASGTKQLVAYISHKETGEPELWASSPTSGGDPFYDDVLYNAMSHDEARHALYRRALEELAKDKVVVDIGTGRDALLARTAIEAGARKVYAIELLEEPAAKAKALVAQLGLADKIEVIHGRSQTITLPEKADVCVSENVGHIGGTEGCDVILNDARRFLKPDGHVIPARCVTRVAAVAMPETFLQDPAFEELGAYYAQKMWELAGYKHDFRVCVTNVSRELLRSSADVFEDIDFAQPVAASYERKIHLAISRDSKIDGFLLWLNLEIKRGDVLETLGRADMWYPVYLPAFYPGLDVSAGDRIEATVSGALAANGINRDYKITGCVMRKNGARFDFAFDSPHYQAGYKQTPFYERIFRNDTIKTNASGMAKSELLSALKKSLPDYMVPSSIVILPALPRTPNGKLDRRALPAPNSTPNEAKQNFVAPRTPLEEKLAEVWRSILKIERIGVHDNFFELGGDSLLALRIVNRLRHVLGGAISLVVIFEAPNIAALAELLEKNHSQCTAKLAARGAANPAGEMNLSPDVSAASFAPALQPIMRVARDARKIAKSSV
jgi:amino acid adenylation domain-containing protein